MFIIVRGIRYEFNMRVHRAGNVLDVSIALVASIVPELRYKNPVCSGCAVNCRVTH